VWLIAEFEEQLEELFAIVRPHWRPNLDLHGGSIHATGKMNHRGGLAIRARWSLGPREGAGSARELVDVVDDDLTGLTTR